MSTPVPDQSTLAAAQMRLERATHALAIKQKSGEPVEWIAATYEAVLAAERDLAAAQNEPHAVPIEFPVQWDIGAPLPYLLRNDDRTFLVFFLRDIDSDWDGTYVNIRRADDPNPTRLAVVEFKRCICAKMGTPNDEVFHGHPLHGKGFVGYRPLRVKNSPWIKELETINSVHVAYGPESWSTLNHYIFGFHDSTFECVAESFVVEMLFRSGCTAPTTAILNPWRDRWLAPCHGMPPDPRGRGGTPDPRARD
jgi:hypothetical protein